MRVGHTYRHFETIERIIMKKSISLLAMPSWMHIKDTLISIEKQKDELEIDSLHIDVMDGHFAPNIAFGPALVRDIATHTSLPLDLHLMIDCFDTMLPHYKTIPHRHMYIPFEVIVSHRRSNIAPFAYDDTYLKHISLNIETPINDVLFYVKHIESVLLMTVHVGFAGQKMIKDRLKIVDQLKKANPRLTILVDGGVHENTFKIVKQFDVDGIVMGSWFFSCDR